MGRREAEVRMPEALLWAVAILLAVAAGWAWNSWRHRVANRRPGTRAIITTVVKNIPEAVKEAV
ncbi:hypothetical protein ABZ403_13165, partial [Micromonospora zamorensis]